jgi:hypothetical protein
MKEKRKNTNHRGKTIDGLFQAGIYSGECKLKDIVNINYPTKINWDYVGKDQNLRNIIAEYEGGNLSRTHVEGHFLRAAIINTKASFELVWVVENQKAYDRIDAYHKVLSKYMRLPSQTIVILK